MLLCCYAHIVCSVITFKYLFIFLAAPQDHQAVISELDLVEEDDQITHLLRLDDDGATEDILSKQNSATLGFCISLFFIRIRYAFDFEIKF